MNEKTPELIALEATLKGKDDQITLLSEKVASLDTELSRARVDAGTKGSEIARLSAELQTAQAKSNQATNQLESLDAKLKAAEKENAKLAADLQAKTDASLTQDVKRIVTKALDRGVKPALFDGVDKDPAGWFKARFASLEILQQFVDALPETEDEKVSSGRPNADDADTLGLSQARAENLRKLGLRPEMALVKDSNDLKRFAKK